jgi:hypothetical protein
MGRVDVTRCGAYPRSRTCLDVLSLPLPSFSAELFFLGMRPSALVSGFLFRPSHVVYVSVFSMYVYTFTLNLSIITMIICLPIPLFLVCSSRIDNIDRSLRCVRVSLGEM